MFPGLDNERLFSLFTNCLFLNQNFFWMLAGMPKENHSQPGHPAVDSTEGRRNGKKVDRLPAEEEMQKAYRARLIHAEIISAIWGPKIKS